MTRFFDQWGLMVECLKKTRRKEPYRNEERAALDKFRARRDHVIVSAFDRRPHIHTLAQFQCAMDALQSVTVSYEKLDKPDMCLFSGSKENLYFVSFVRFIDRAPTLANIQTLVTPTVNYCVSQVFLFFVLALHFLGRIETLLFSADSNDRLIKIITQFEFCMKFLQRFQDV